MKQKVLYIEDELTLGLLVKESLEKNGYDVLKITNGTDGLITFKTYQPHLCLLDIMLPGNDGYSVTEQIRSIDRHVPIIMLTAKVQAADLVKGFKSGCNDYIRKPFNMEELLLRVANWLDVKYADKRSIESNIAISKYAFDPNKQLLEYNDNIVRLSHKETELLKVLLNYKNDIVSRDYILQKVWGTDTVYNSRTLDVYITRLRKYFKQDSHISLITLKGIGYRFIC
ncbi:MAG TPA: response regulator transcription factor [Flavipsychrobacter sp.]|nr:response regulator transcription factor [Flavipsychrobacter sp.]